VVRKNRIKKVKRDTYRMWNESAMCSQQLPRALRRCCRNDCTRLLQISAFYMNYEASFGSSVGGIVTELPTNRPELGGKRGRILD
jgi:hypothetical protein